MLRLLLLLIACAVLVRTEEMNCLEGAQCQNATSVSSDGHTTKCCTNGYSMTSVSNAVINGQLVNYCKCTRFNRNGGTFNVGSNNNGIIFSGGTSRPMTEAERVQFSQNMNQFQQNLQNQMNQMKQTLAENNAAFKAQFSKGFMGGFPWGRR